jgi:hypothetical protein
MITDLEVFAAICDEADAAGRLAVSKLKVTPMIVGTAKGLFSNEIDYSKPVEYVSDGACGFAWIVVYTKNKGNTRLGKQERAALEAAGFEKDYDSSKRYTLWVSDFNQSLQKKETYARAFAEVLRNYDIVAYGQSRMD